MPRLSKKPAVKPDVLEVVHHEIPENAAGAGAAPIPARAYKDGGITWRRMLRMCASAEAAGLVALLAILPFYGVGFFAPAAIAVVLLGISIWRLPRMTKASAVYSLVVQCLMLVMFGGLFFGWTGFMYPQSWFEMTWATITVTLPIGGIAAGIATLRHKDGDNAAKIPSRVVAGLAAVVVMVGLVGSVLASDATKLPGDATLTASNIEFEQTALTHAAGDVPIYFENQDPFAHNVTIDGHGASSIANGGQSIRHVFKNMSAGTYEYYCEIHPDMKGTLTVT